VQLSARKSVVVVFKLDVDDPGDHDSDDSRPDDDHG
jgi:hypothetical protein